MQSVRERIHNAGVAALPHDDLPIARIGIVQPHGVMAVVDDRGRYIEHISANVEELLGVPAAHVLGRDIASLFTDYDTRRAVEAACQPGRLYFDNPIRTIVNGREFEIVIHAHAGAKIFEIEPYVAPARDYQSLVAEATAELAGQQTVASLYRASVDLLQEVTGYDRVMLYRFEGRGHGQVVAEKLGTSTISFDGLYFPAADIPAEARKILTNGKTRYTPCVTRPGSLMLRLDGTTPVESGDVIDMTHAWLRGVHSCHNGYMSHISTKGSMVFPVMVDDTLWGLFVCHNGEEKYLDYESRVVVEQMTMMFICKLIELEAIEQRLDIRREQLDRLRAALSDAAEMDLALARSPDGPLRHEMRRSLARATANLAPTAVGSPRGAESALNDFEKDLLGFVQADGAAIVRGGRAHLIGDGPGELAALGVAAAFGAALPSLTDTVWRVWATNCLPELLPSALEHKATASGVLAAPLDETGRDMLLWFRREEVVDAVWAGRPPSEEELRASSMNTPRSSFGRVEQRIGGAARDWTETQVMMAAEFGDVARAALSGRAVGAIHRRIERSFVGPDLAPSEPAAVHAPLDAPRIRTRETLGSGHR